MSPFPCLNDQQLWISATQGPLAPASAGHLRDCTECQRKRATLISELHLLRNCEQQSFPSCATGESSRFGSSLSDASLDEQLTRLVVHAARERETSSPSLSGPATGHPLLRERRIGKYELRECLSQGGQAVVFRAWDPQLRRDVAVKLSWRPLRRGDGSRSRIAREGTLLAQIDDPHLARIYDCGVHRNYVYLVMEYVRGVDLKQFAEFRPLRSDRIRQIMQDVSGAVAAAHRRGILHLDLKPENVLITADGRCKLIDFGMGWICSRRRAARQRIVAGTFEYMSPEQLRGETGTWSPATDVYGLGGLLCFLLTGSAPLPPATKVTQRLDAELRRTLKQLSLGGRDRRLVRICRRALSPVPSRRFPNAVAFQRELLPHHRPPRRGLLLVMIVSLSLLLARGIARLGSYVTDEPSLAATVRQQTIPSPMPGSPGTRNVLLDIPAPGWERFELFYWSLPTGVVPLQGAVPAISGETIAGMGDVATIEVVLPSTADVCAVIAVQGSAVPSGQLSPFKQVWHELEERLFNRSTQTEDLAHGCSWWHPERTLAQQDAPWKTLEERLERLKVPVQAHLFWFDVDAGIQRCTLKPGLHQVDSGSRTRSDGLQPCCVAHRAAGGLGRR